jgi:ABC-2 type transport system ATP-binding protein
LVKQILEEQRQTGSAILMSTHQMYQAEALCERIVLIDRGRTVLYGTLDEIKHSFAGNAVVVAGQGDFANIPGVLEARHENGDWRLALEPGADPQAVFRALAARPGVRIERFELAEPSLDDIFVNVVQGSASAEGGGDA